MKKSSELKMRGESITSLFFTEKKPLFIVAGKSWRGDLDDEIGIKTSELQFRLEIHLSRENLKRLSIVIQERLKDNVESAVFSQNRKLHLNLKKAESA
ncbi:MAG TPA: hypothetical protein ENI18_08805 [Candidatus Aminicenantes bacterium]|nr:hypothetical protein [Candidatus Aminicenantes bacterium]